MIDLRPVLSGVSSPVLGLHFQTLSIYSPLFTRPLQSCLGCLGLYARAGARYLSSPIKFFLMREQITLSTLDTLSSYIKVIVFIRVLMSRVVSRVGLFLSGVLIQGDFHD